MIPVWKHPMKMNKDPYLFSQTAVLPQQIPLFQCVSLYYNVLLNGSHTS